MPAVISSRAPKSTAAPEPNPNGPDALAVDAAFAALRAYDRGSSRAALLPIDEAVRRAVGTPAGREPLEARLLAALRAGCTAVGAEYICAKLALVGSDRCVPVLAGLLADAERATAARTALEALPGPAATRALRAQLSRRTGRLRVGVIQSLAVRRDPAAVRDLTALLRSSDDEIVRSAAAALGEIATPRAATALRKFLGQAREALRASVADAMLICAERLRATGRMSEARELYRGLAGLPLPAHVQWAAQRGWEATARTPRS